MTTTPTQLWTVNYQGEAVLTKDGLKIGGTLEPAAHDDLIAAMPRCGTCDRWRAFEQGTELGICRVIDTTVSVVVGKDFGCRRHKERNNG